jgi:uncharacterized protein YhdP
MSQVAASEHEPSRARSPTSGQRTRSRAAWLRVLLAVAAMLLVLGGLAVFTYQLALARIPEHRAALERLVRARTGLDVRFNELGVRWGWYGPEVVFSAVELGEPERSNVLLRAAALIVGFDAWRTLQTGELQAGRITLVEPDIDIARLQPRDGLSASARPVASWQLGMLERWPNGRIDFEGGTLSVPDPHAPAHTLVVRLRSATLRRLEHRWQANVFAYLPDSLGRTVRLSMELSGNPRELRTLAGAARVDARGLQFSSWRELLQPTGAWARHLPRAGTGTLNFRLALLHGRLSESAGTLSAAGVRLPAPADSGPPAIRGLEEADLDLGDLQGSFTAAAGEGAWHVSVTGLQIGPASVAMSPSELLLDVAEDGSWVRAGLQAAPLEALRPAWRWLLPESPIDPATAGVAHDVRVDWQAARPVGSRLRLALGIKGLTVRMDDGSRLAGIAARVSGSESALLAELEGTPLQLTLPDATGAALPPLRLASRLQLRRESQGWSLATARTQLADAHGTLLIDGTLQLRRGEPAAITVHASLLGAELAPWRELIAHEAPPAFAPMLGTLTSGRIARAELNWAGRLGDDGLARLCNGSATLEDGSLAVETQWRGETARAVRITGQVRAQAEDVLLWLRAHPELATSAAGLRELDATGPVQVSFNASLSPAGALADHARVLTRLNGLAVRLAPRLPPLEDVRGLLVYDSGRLQRSTLTAAWLGGRTELHLAARRDAQDGGFELQAQGALRSRDVLAAWGVDPRLIDLSGGTAWRGELTVAPAGPSGALSWRAHAESPLAGVRSALPAPLAKAESLAQPLRLDAQGSGERALVSVALADTAHGVFELATRPDGTWHALRAAVRFGGAPAALPTAASIDVQGSLARLDLPAWVAAWRELARMPGAPPVQAALSVDALLLAHDRVGVATITALPEGGADVLRVESPGFAGSMRWPRDGSQAPVDVHLARLKVPSLGDGGAALWLAAVGPVAQLAVDQLTWDGRSLGSVGARFKADGGGVALEELRASGPDYAASGEVSCVPLERPCRMHFKFESDDAAAAARTLGFEPALSGRASLEGDLNWSMSADMERARVLWPRGLTGSVRVALADGAVQAEHSPAGRGAPLSALIELLRRGASAESRAADAADEGLRFARLSGDFALQEGNALTSNLHLDGQTEILIEGRIGLAAQDFDCRAVILRGSERLPDAVRRLSAAPHVAAAWLALRDLWPTAAAAATRTQLHVGGTWDAPLIERVR